MITLKVQGMTCGHCENSVRKSLATVEGVERVVAVDRKAQRAVVEGRADAKALVAAVQQEGYVAQVID